MNAWVDFFNIFISGSALLLSVMGIWFIIIIPGTDRWSKRFFMSYFIIFMLCDVSGIIEVALQYYNAPNGVLYFLIFLEILLLSLPLPMITVYLLHSCRERIRESRLFRAVSVLFAVFFVMLAGIPFIDCFIYFTPDDQYARGPLYPLLLAPMLAVLLLNLTGTIRRRLRMSRKTFTSFIVSQVPIAVTLTVQIFVDIYSLVGISFVISALAMYGFILSDQIEKDLLRQKEIARQQQEIAHERASVLVLQMRPHFIYNTLMSIYSLCRLDPGKARQITVDFANYLRKNFNAVSSDSTIPFSTELEHTRAYLAVEQAQFDDMLVVEYDTPFTRFRLPPLTLQPLVENSVKHGMNPLAGPLHIRVRTRHTDAGTEVIVEDNGPGFDPEETGRPQTTLINIRQRLEMMCQGTMTILPREGGGTVVKLTIPS